MEVTSSLSETDFSFDDFTISNKSNGRKKFKLDNIQSNIDKQPLIVLKKIDELSINHFHKKQLLIKLVITRKILDIVKVLKFSETSIILHGKINLERKEFSELTDCDDVVIKIVLNKNLRHL